MSTMHIVQTWHGQKLGYFWNAITGYFLYFLKGLPRVMYKNSSGPCIDLHPT